MASLPENALEPGTRAAWRAWLEAHHGRPQGLWLVTFKRRSGRGGLTFEEAIEEALCFGWIDSRPRKLDDERTMLWFAPRQPRSNWSRINRERVDRMEAAGRMHPSGQAKVDAARRDGSWSALDSADALEVPVDLAEAFSAQPPAADCFAAFPPSARRAILEWIGSARTAPTRARRVEETARLAARNERANQWPRRPK